MDFNGTFLVTIITFILFVFIMNKILYAPILRIMEERRNFIDSNYKDAKVNDNRTNELAEKRENKLKEAKNDGREKYLEAIENFKTQRDAELEAVQEKNRYELTRSGKELSKIADDVKDNLKNSMTVLATDIVEKIIGYRSEVQGFDNDKVSSILWGDK